MTLQEVWSLLNLYNSSFSGEQIDEAVGVILNGGISAAVDAAQASADAAAKSATDAAGSAASVGAAATNAQSAASRASGSATEAESYAHGGTGTREGEDEDNARYYAALAREAAGGGVLTVNGQFPDEMGNVDVGGVKTVNGQEPDAAGNLDLTPANVGAIDSKDKGKAGGVPELGADGKVPSSQLPATMTPSAHAESHKAGGSDALTPADIGAAGKSATVIVTLAANGWADGVYVLSVNGVTATSNQELLPAVDITAEQLTALQGANIQDGGQTAGSITLKAYGDVPTIDIPIRVIKRGD